MENKNKLLTIIVPAYNVEKYVKQCLDSLLNQTIEDFNTIIVDDGSNDKYTSEICRSYAQKNPNRITYVCQKNKGLGAARNAGLSLVNTEYVGFLDSDDWLDLNYVQRVVEEIERYQEEIDIIFTLPTIYDSITQLSSNWSDTELFNDIFDIKRKIVSAQEEFRLFSLEVSACRRIYRVDFLKEHNFSFPEGVKWEDVYPHFYLLYYAKSCLGINDVGFHYRINTGMQITNSSDSSRLDIIKVFAKTFKFALSVECNPKIWDSIIRTYTAFSIWSLNVSCPEVRKVLAMRTHDLYRLLPNKLIKGYLKTNKFNRKECLFIKLMKQSYGSYLFVDYFYVELGRNVINKLRGRK